MNTGFLSFLCWAQNYFNSNIFIHLLVKDGAYQLSYLLTEIPIGIVVP